MKTRGGILLLPLLILCSCQNINENNPYVPEGLDYTEYENVFGGLKGTEIYCWKIDNQYWCCGALIGTNRLKTYEEIHHIQNDLPCTLSKMKEFIINSHSTKEEIAVFDIPSNLSKEEFESLDRSQCIETPNAPYLYSSLGLI